MLLEFDVWHQFAFGGSQFSHSVLRFAEVYCKTYAGEQELSICFCHWHGGLYTKASTIQGDRRFVCQYGQHVPIILICCLSVYMWCRWFEMRKRSSAVIPVVGRLPFGRPQFSGLASDRYLQYVVSSPQVWQIASLGIKVLFLTWIGSVERFVHFCTQERQPM